MSSLLHERKVSSLLVSFISIIIGIVLLVFKNNAVSLICIIAGILLALLGAYYIITYFVRKDKIVALRADLIVGIILFFVGAWMISNPKSVIALLQYVVGAIIVVHGIVDLQAAINIKRSKAISSKGAFILSLATIILGIAIIINPFGAIDTLLIIIGVILIFDGVSDLFIINRLGKVYKQAKQESEAIETDGEVIE